MRVIVYVYVLSGIMVFKHSGLGSNFDMNRHGWTRMNGTGCDAFQIQFDVRVRMKTNI